MPINWQVILMKKIKWLLQVCFLAVFAFLFTAVLPQTARADFAERPVGFVVIDQDGGVDGAVYKEWRQMVKLGYRFPDYQIIDGGEAQKLVSQAVRDGVKLDAASLAALAEKSKMDVLVVARIYEMDETLVSGWSMRFDNDTYVRVAASADLFVYKKDGNKFLKKRVRESGLREMGNYEKSAETIKWQLSKLVNTMENKPIIGS
jgi:flavin-binding protein dodecin